MPKYLIQGSYTAEAVEGVRTRGGSSRRDAVAETIRSLGGSAGEQADGSAEQDKNPPRNAMHRRTALPGCATK